VNKIDHFKIYLHFSGDVSADVNHLHIIKFYLVNFSYIIIDDKLYLVIKKGLAVGPHEESELYHYDLTTNLLRFVLTPYQGERKGACI
jgi:hypothetical protein